MSRLSDTRQRTREAAAALVVTGKRPHELTVDLIFAAIQQGSRTTINDELKQWKEERSKADALGADLPPTVADAMRSLWVTAVEHGAQVFGDQRQALESDLSMLQQAHATLTVERDEVRGAARQLQEEVAQLREQGSEWQHQLAHETEAKCDALGQVQALQHEVSTVRADMAHQLDLARQSQDRLIAEFQTTIATRDVAFQAERDKANERVEAAQARMLKETDAAREGQRHAEQQLAKLRQRTEGQQTSLTELRMEVAGHRRELAEGETRLATLTGAIAQRDQLALDLAAARGQMAGMASAVQSAEARAMAAETQLAAGQPASRKRRRPE